MARTYRLRRGSACIGRAARVAQRSGRGAQVVNSVIRQALKERGLVDTPEVAHAILVNRDLTRSQRGHARNYEVGNVVRFTRGSRRMEIEKGAYAAFERADSDVGRL